MINEILSISWIFAPAAFANMAPVIANNIDIIKKYNTPIDLRKTYKGRRLLGDNKTYRGLVAGVVMGIFVVSVEIFIYQNLEWTHQFTKGINYGEISVLMIGLLMGLGAGIGDAVESFFKRLKNIKPGDNWFPFDQIDFITGAIILCLPIFVLPLGTYLVLYVMSLALHPTINIIGWLLGLQKTPF